MSVIKNIKVKGTQLASKTGTSRKPKINGAGYMNGLYYTSTIGFLPATDPQVLIYVVVDSARGGNIFGSTVAAPVFNAIATQIVSILNLTPDKHKKK